MAKHSNIGASSCHRWWNCPGSVALSADIPPQPSSPHAKEGTAAHEMAEEAIKQQVHPRQLVGQKATNGVKWTTDMADHVEFYLTTIANDVIDAGLEMDQVHFETRFQLKEVDEDAFGTCDAYFVQPFGRLVVYDLKYGQGVIVEAKDNLQMQYYALGALQDALDVKEVEMVIVQPRTEEKVKRWTVQVDDITTFAEQLKAKIEATKVDGAALVDGKHCRWCPAMATCPQVSKKVVEVAQRDFQDATPLPEPGALTLPQLKLVLDKAELLTDWVASVEVYAKALLEAGSRIEGWKLVPKRAHRKWKDEFEVETALTDLGDRIYDKKLKTPKQMEAVAGKEKVAELSETPDKGFTLAKDEDARIEAASDFTRIETAAWVATVDTLCDPVKKAEVLAQIETNKPKRKRRTKQEMENDRLKDQKSIDADF